MRKESTNGLGGSLWKMGRRDEGDSPEAKLVKVEGGAGVINTTCGLISRKS